MYNQKSRGVLNAFRKLPMRTKILENRLFFMLVEISITKRFKELRDKN
jgi:hypothetical protein